MTVRKNSFQLARKVQDKEQLDFVINWERTTMMFEDELFNQGINWDNNDDDVFNRWNQKWINYCNSSKYKTIKPDPKLFFDYAINKESQRFNPEKQDTEKEDTPV